MWRDPNCGCCDAYAGYLEENGYTVKRIDDRDFDKTSISVGVPEQGMGCHLAKIDRYFVSGLVPVDIMERLVAELVLEPSTLRNKIAHGQWRVPLNRANTSVNEKLEADLSKLDVVTVDTWKVRQQKLCELVELLIESPNKAFMATYWNLIEEIQDIGVKRKDWNAESKQTRLKA